MLNHSRLPQPLSKFGFYQIIEGKILAQGFNSLVYEGVNVLTGVHVCIKRIILLNELQHKLAYNELFCLKELSHPNVLQYLYDFRTTNEIYIVTELCQETLSTRLRKQGKFSQIDALVIFSQILSGYKEMRAKGYLHRDLKPQNIFYNKGQIKIADFGFCSKTKLPELKEDYNIGTPFYMAPEAIQHNTYSQKTDIWSLGVIFYQLIHGKVPFTSKSEKDLIKQLKSLIIRFECDPQLQKIVRNMLNPNRVKRFNLQDLQSALSKYLQMEKKNRYTQIQGKISNQIKYAHFLQYVQLISSKIRNSTKKSRINFLLQYSLRMRFGLIETLEQSSPVIQIKLKRQVQDLKSRHQSALKLPQPLNQTDKLKFLSAEKPAFNYFTLWHIQAELKDTLKQLLRELSNIDSEEKVARNEEQVKLADFLLTAYVINRMLIDNESCMQQFSEMLQLDLILNRPHRLNLNVYRAIKQKGQELCII